MNRLHLLVRTVTIAALLTLGTTAASAARHSPAATCSAQFLVEHTFASGAKWTMCWEPRQLEGIVLHDITYTTPTGEEFRPRSGKSRPDPRPLRRQRRTPPRRDRRRLGRRGLLRPHDCRLPRRNPVVVQRCPCPVPERRAPGLRVQVVREQRPGPTPEVVQRFVRRRIQLHRRMELRRRRIDRAPSRSRGRPPTHVVESGVRMATRSGTVRRLTSTATTGDSTSTSAA